MILFADFVSKEKNENFLSNCISNNKIRSCKLQKKTISPNQRRADLVFTVLFMEPHTMGLFGHPKTTETNRHRTSQWFSHLNKNISTIYGDFQILWVSRYDLLVLIQYGNPNVPIIIYKIDDYLFESVRPDAMYGQIGISCKFQAQNLHFAVTINTVNGGYFLKIIPLPAQSKPLKMSTRQFIGIFMCVAVALLSWMDQKDNSLTCFQIQKL